MPKWDGIVRHYQEVVSPTSCSFLETASSQTVDNVVKHARVSQAHIVPLAPFLPNAAVTGKRRERQTSTYFPRYMRRSYSTLESFSLSCTRWCLSSLCPAFFCRVGEGHGDSTFYSTPMKAQLLCSILQSKRLRLLADAHNAAWTS